MNTTWILSQPSTDYKTVTDIYLQLKLIEKVTVNNFAEKSVFFTKPHSIQEYFSYIRHIPISTGKPKFCGNIPVSDTFLSYYLTWSYKMLGPWPILNSLNYTKPNYTEDINLVNIGVRKIGFSLNYYEEEMLISAAAQEIMATNLNNAQYLWTVGDYIEYVSCTSSTESVT